MLEYKGLDGEVRILNPAGRRLLNVPEEAPRDDYRQMIGEPALSQVIDECLTTRGTIVRRTIRLPETRDGASHLGVTVSPLFGDAAELHGAICLFTDLTAVHELEERLRLKEGLATLGELTAGIAHEFRNGLATIHGYSKLMDLNALPYAYRATDPDACGPADGLRTGGRRTAGRRPVAWRGDCDPRRVQHR